MSESPNFGSYRNQATPPPVPRRPAPLTLGTLAVVPILVMSLIVFIPVFIWFFCRIELGVGEIAVLIHKTGKDLPSGQILAETPDQKGIQLEVLPEGRHWRNPYSWTWKKSTITDIPAGKLGVQTRLYGETLPPNQVIAGPKQRGILAEVLGTGRHRINPYAYKVDLYDAISIRPGCVGVVTSLVGDDVFSLTSSNKPNGFLVTEGQKGVLSTVLDPGTYYLNPYLYSVVELNLQSQRFEMSGVDAINFLTMDGFTVSVEGTIEFALQREQAALLTHRVGEMNDIIKKVILPRARGFSRIEGSKHPATTFIVGETRQQFQRDLENHLRSTCEPWGVSIRSVLIRNINPPDEIASIIRDREVAVQESKKYDQEISQAQSKAELVKQEMLAQQSKAKVESETARISAVINAQQEQSVRVVSANKDLEVAKLENQAAAAQAQAVMLRAQADADVVKMQNLAEASILANQVQAFSNGMNFARNAFYKKIGPRIDSILSTDQKEGLGALFLPYLPQTKEVQP
jgi:regulator of protease activity HflC (stomatin/prohibitin superfamily)